MQKQDGEKRPGRGEGTAMRAVTLMGAAGGWVTGVWALK